MTPKQASLHQFSREVTEIMPFLLREFVKREKNDLATGRISFPQMVALDLLAQRSRVKMSEIAHALSVQLSTATPLVDRLICEGMAARSRDDKDRRLVWVTATAKGRKVVGDILREKQASIRAIFGALTDEERAQYLCVLKKVRCHLIGEEPKSCVKPARA
jgi:DNA-binding MarR family transcriptional regulator